MDLSSQRSYVVQYLSKEEKLWPLASIDIEQYVKVAANVKLLPKDSTCLDAEADVAYINSQSLNP